MTDRVASGAGCTDTVKSTLGRSTAALRHKAPARRNPTTMLRALCVAALSVTAAVAQSLSPIQAIKRELSGLARPLPNNLCPYGAPGSIVSLRQRLSTLRVEPSGSLAIALAITGSYHSNIFYRCFLPALVSEARVMHDRVAATDVEQVCVAGQPRRRTPGMMDASRPARSLHAFSGAFAARRPLGPARGSHESAAPHHAQ